MSDNKLAIFKEKLEDLIYIIKRNSRFKYMAFTIIFSGGLLFFLSSNMLFNSTSNDVSTELNIPLAYDTINISLQSREYNSTNGFIKFNIKVEDKNINRELKPRFELRSKSDPGALIPLTSIKVTDNEYVVITTHNKKWSYLSLQVYLEDMNNKDNEDVGPFKLYSNIKDFVKNDLLVQKSDKEYYVEIVDREILNIENQIIEYENQIQNNKLAIENIIDKNKKLEEEKKYQIDTELANTESIINSNILAINSLESNNNELTQLIIKSKEKISKLEIKKSDYLTGNRNE
ncbi:hypothetical protein ACQPUY_15650 [Clostridium nigeriense]|uniref:hypothetical protein n=1 Tax=Clostridium nigeriense TaxID=1805470 RepID=UPI003D35841E